MTIRAFDFSRRPFRDERPLVLGAGIALVLAAGLAFANVRQYTEFHRKIEGTALQVESLESRRDRAVREASAAHTALDQYRTSNLAQQSGALLRLISERRFSWTALLGRLEKTLPVDVRVARLSPRFNEKGEMSIDCSLVGKGGDAVVRTITAFARDPLFEAIDLRGEAAPDAGRPEGYTFDIVLRYRKPAPRGPS